MNFLKLEDMELEGKKIIVRVDFNVPIKDGKVTDDTRIQRSLPTINYLLEKGCKIVLMSHLGRPHKDKNLSYDELKEKWTIKPAVDRLSKILDRKVILAQDYKEKDIPDAPIVMLENLRIYPEEKKNDEEFAKRLASFAEIYVNDGFGVCHRDQASVTAITKFIPSCAGKLVENEFEKLSKLLRPEKPFIAIIGGAKADKIEVIKALLPKVDKMIIGGVLANTFLKAKGIDIKSSKFDEETLEIAKDLISNEKIILPIDVVSASEFSEDAEVKNTDVDNIPDGWIAVDIGENTVISYKNLLKEAKTVMWGGPLGVFEIDKFSKGTRNIAEFISNLDATTIIGGGDSAAAVNKLGFSDKMTHVSTGGGASLQFIVKEGKLPGFVALEESAKRE